MYIEIDKYKNQNSNTSIYIRDLKVMGVEELSELQDRLLNGFKRVYEQMVIKQNTKEEEEEEEESCQMGLDIESIEKIEIDFNYKIEGSDVQGYAQTVKRKIAQNYQVVQRQVEEYKGRV